MNKRLLNTLAIIALVVSVVMVVWLGSFKFGFYGPSDTTQTLLYWAVSSLVFVLMVTLGFILFRTGVKLYIERRSNREGSRIKTKLMIGALALTSVPAVFLAIFSYEVLNFNLDKWFSRPAEIQVSAYGEITAALERENREKAGLEAALLAAMPETRSMSYEGIPAPGFLERFRREQGLLAAAVRPPSGAAYLDSAGFFPGTTGPGGQVTVARAPVRDAQGIVRGWAVVAAQVPVDVASKQAAINRFNREYGQLRQYRKEFRNYYLLLIALITLFVLFLATWAARIMAGQISGPIAALVRAAGEVRRGNLKHRVEVRAIDELAGLVRGFNAMTQELEANARELDARRRFTEAILESIPTGVISITAEGVIKRVNRALNGMFPEAQVARAARLEDLFSREDTAEIKYLMKRARRTGLAARPMELKTSTQNLHLTVTVSALEEKLTSGFVVVLEDTTDVLRAQKAAAWTEVARRVAHEIKNPLTPIALSAERIGRQLQRLDTLPPETRLIVEQCGETIAHSVETVKTLVDEFSQFARFPTAHPTRGDLNEVVESALAVFAGRLDGVEIRTQLERGLPAVNIDREQFKRAIVNLVDNAAEAMQETLIKKLFIATQLAAPDTVELVIADTGCGVTPEDREKLFLPYFSTKGRGTGLGLAIVSHIIADHNAHIRVENNAPAGTRFTIEIPALVETEAVAIEA